MKSKTIGIFLMLAVVFIFDTDTFGTDAADVTYNQGSAKAIDRTVKGKLQESVSVKDFGAVGDGRADDTAAVKAAIAASNRVFFPAGTYYIKETINLKKTITLYGETGTVGGSYPSTLQFDANIVGIIVHRGNTNADNKGVPYIESPATTGADGSIIQNLGIQRGNGRLPTINAVSHGVWLKARARISGCFIRGFAGDGVHISASAKSELAQTAGNANNFHLEDLRIQENHHGIYVDGPDANSGSIVNCDASENAGWGFWDSSFLGNNYIGCHAAANTLGSFKTDGESARNLFVGCYREVDQPAASVISPSVHVGGLSDTGVGLARMLTDWIGEGTTYAPNKTGVSKVTMTSGGAGYTSAPSVTFDAPTGYGTATATASIVNGKITQIKITNAGAGYSAAPVVTITGNGTGGQATATIENGRVTAITVTASETDNAGGSGYTTATVTLSGPKVKTATGNAYLNASGQVAYVVMTEKGAGYTSAPKVLFSVGVGTGAAGTAELTSDEYIKVLGNNSYGNDNLFEFWRSDVSASKPWRLKCLPNSGDILFDFANLAGSRPFRISGPQTTLGYGRTAPVPYVFEATKFSLGQKIQSEATAMPTTGEYSRGDRVFNTAATEIGTSGSKYIVLGWYRLKPGSNHVLNTDWVEMRCLTGN